MVILSKGIIYLERFNTFLITQAKTPKEVGHQSYVSEIRLATRDTFLRLSWPGKSLGVSLPQTHAVSCTSHYGTINNPLGPCLKKA